MKKFSVPVKKRLDDFTCTKDVWLSTDEQADQYALYKKDTKAELFLALADSQAQLPAPEESSNQSLKHLYSASVKADGSCLMMYIDSDNGLVKAHNRASFKCYLFRRRHHHQPPLVLGQGPDIYLEKDDVILVFNKEASSRDLEKIHKIILHSRDISYVLLSSIKDMLHREGEKLIPFLIIDRSDNVSYSFPIRSNLKTVAMAVDMFKNKILKYSCDKIWQIETVLHEALVNSMTYGNEMDNGKTITVQYEIGERGLRVLVKDVGEGFDVFNVSVPVGEEALERISGRGIYIMRKFSSNMYYNDKGNEVLLFFGF